MDCENKLQLSSSSLSDSLFLAVGSLKITFVMRPAWFEVAFNSWSCINLYLTPTAWWHGKKLRIQDLANKWKKKLMAFLDVTTGNLCGTFCRTSHHDANNCMLKQVCWFLLAMQGLCWSWKHHVQTYGIPAMLQSKLVIMWHILCNKLLCQCLYI